MNLLEILGVMFIALLAGAIFALIMAYRSVVRGQVVNFSRLRAYFEGLGAEGRNLDKLVFSTKHRDKYIVF